ncbi:MAG TPA: IPT/TIG domain-containing protein [Gaiellaceae bacterium]|nr:IPT/TIG domain-containing protein [Gaiellaceae bacterium]
MRSPRRILGVAALLCLGLLALGGAADAAGPTPQLFGWGRYVTTPAPIALPDGVYAAAVSGGGFHNLALGSDGKIYGWGDNADGELGDGTTTRSATPVAAVLPGGVAAVAVSAGSSPYYGRPFSLALGADGDVYAWGGNGYGQLGDGTTTPELTPERIQLPGGVHAVAVSAGGRASLVLGSDGDLYVWGDNTFGELGDGTTTSRSTPERVALPGGVHATAVAAGFVYDLVLGADGAVYAWGTSPDGVLHATPGQVPLPGGAHATAVAISNGPEGGAALVLGADGTIYSWGANGYGQLGDGTQTEHDTPEPVALPGGVDAVAVAAGGRHGLAIGSDGNVYVWGWNAEGELGDGLGIAHFSPKQLVLPGGVAATSISAGDLTSFAIGVLPAPRFLGATPPATAAAGSTLDYTFLATGRPTYSLAPGAPPWLSIDATSGRLTGTLPADAESFAFSVVATNAAGSTTAGPFAVTVPAAPVHVTGTVTRAADGTVVAGALVDACTSDGGVCVSATTDASGLFDLTVASGSTLTLHAYPPKSEGILGATTTVDVGKTDVSGVTVELPAPSRLGALQLTGGLVGSSGGLPVLHWARTTDVSFAGCPNGFGTVSVVGRNTKTGTYDYDVSSLAETAPGSGVYSGSLPPQYPIHGPVQLSSASHCDGTSPSLRRLQSVALSGLDILAAIRALGPQLLLGHVTYKAMVDSQMAGLHPSCSGDKAAAKSALGLALRLAFKPVVTAAMPAIEATLATVFAETGPLDVIVWLATPTIVSYATGMIADDLASAAIDAALADCPQPDGLDPNALIDPSGTVLDTNGNPVAGATTTILRADTQAGPFAPVDATQPGIEPAVNPETTGVDGVFHWDVRSGSYEVRASAPACSTATVGPYPVPPPQVGLTVTLACQNEQPAPKPVVDGLGVSTGPPAGGTAVRVLGSGFTPSSAVSFGGTAAASVTFLSPELLSAVTPHGHGAVDVVVTTSGGASATSSADTFFFGTTPSVSGLSAAEGGTAGGTTLTVSGSGLDGATAVAFGRALGTNLRVLSDSQLRVTTPAAAAGTVDVVVVTPAGASATGATDRFTFTAAAKGGGGSAPAAGGSAEPSGGTAAPATADTHAPRLAAVLRAGLRRGALVLQWPAASDDVGVDHYELYLNGRPLERVPGSATSARLRVFAPRGTSLFTLRAFDAAGNASDASDAVVARPSARPRSAPRRIPRWAWSLLRWQEHGHRGRRPHPPAPVRRWYPAWAHWRQQPFRLVG